MAIVERFKQEPMYGLSANKSGVGESSTVLLTALGDGDSEKNFLRTSAQGGYLRTVRYLLLRGEGGHEFLKTLPPPLLNTALSSNSP